MSRPSSSLRIVARSQNSLLPTSTTPEKLSLSSTRSPSEPPNSPCTSLGNKLQRLAFLSPNHIVSLELLVDHILRSVEANRRGLYALAVACFL